MPEMRDDGDVRAPASGDGVGGSIRAAGGVDVLGVRRARPSREALLPQVQRSAVVRDAPPVPQTKGHAGARGDPRAASRLALRRLRTSTLKRLVRSNHFTADAEIARPVESPATP